LGAVSILKSKIVKLTTTALLIGIGILLPMVIPTIMIPPASYTIGVHVPIFVAMFISPWMAIAVTFGTTIGFFFSAPLVIVWRAASHLIFVIPAVLYISKANKAELKGFKLRILSFLIAIMHAVAETIAVLTFYMATVFPSGQGMWWVVSFIGFGTIIHSMLDFEIANVVRRALERAGFLGVLR